MRISIRLVAVIQLALIFPAAGFLVAVLVAAGDRPPKYDLARFAHAVITWYAVGGWRLSVLLLLGMPLACLITGGVTIFRSAGRLQAAFGTPLATLLVGWATITSAGILGVVALHILAN